MPTDRQTQDHLLCGECEGVLNRGGETWLSDKLATYERAFPLYDLLTQRPPDLKDGDDLAIYFTAENPSFEGNCLIHFAIGIFWKASVHSWSGTDTGPRIGLGPYSDRLRQWLRNEGDFPQHVYLNAAISRPERAQISFNDPYEAARQSWRTYVVNVPGVSFTLSIGKTVEYPLKALCLQNNTMRPIMLSDELTNSVEKTFAASLLNSRKTKAFEKAMDRIRKSRQPHGS